MKLVDNEFYKLATFVSKLNYKDIKGTQDYFSDKEKYHIQLKFKIPFGNPIARVGHTSKVVEISIQQVIKNKATANFILFFILSCKIKVEGCTWPEADVEALKILKKNKIDIKPVYIEFLEFLKSYPYEINAVRAKEILSYFNKK